MKGLSTFLVPVFVSALLASCTMMPSGRVTLMEGQRGKVGLQTVTLLKVLDNRCPPGVQCVWAGDVVAEVQVVKGRSTSNLTLRFPHDKDSEWQGLRIENVSLTAPLKVTFTDAKP